MSRSGVTCPCCNAPSMTMEDLRLEGKAGGLDADVTVVVVQCNDSREYRAVIPREREVLKQVEVKLPELLEQIPHGELNEPLQPESTRSISCDLYGIDTFGKMFTPRQTLALACFVKATRQARSELSSYPLEWREGIYRLVALNIDRLADRCSTFCRPDPTPTQSGVINTFSKFALSMTWDFIEGVPIANSSGGYIHSLEWIALVVENLTRRVLPMGDSKVVHQSATHSNGLECFDLVMTDPPYYEAISDADLSDFFYVWLKRVNEDLPQFTTALTDKTNEAVQHIRSDKSRIVERSKYESRMAEAFRSINSRLTQEGRFVVVFAHKQPDAWETLVSAMIHAGFVVTGSWPIQTEMSNRGRAIGSASLSSSVWLVCKKRPESARPGWDNRVLEDMRHNIHAKLRDYWDAGIRGPDFVWAATGPALEAYSKHPVVKKANEPGKLMEVSEFLRAVRRLVVDFVVGRVLTGGDETSASGLDDVTTYYILHRHDFGVSDAPVGPCILYAISCNLSDRDLADRFDILLRTGGLSSADDDDEVDEGQRNRCRRRTRGGNGQHRQATPVASAEAENDGL